MLTGKWQLSNHTHTAWQRAVEHSFAAANLTVESKAESKAWSQSTSLGKLCQRCNHHNIIDKLSKLAENSAIVKALLE